MDLSGKTVLITGSTDGVERALMTTAFLPSMRYTRQAGVLWFDISC
jgi:NAD(P)-dependent dehydrogenase (short-subunit alcohol dehydrogenase family)